MNIVIIGFINWIKVLCVTISHTRVSDQMCDIKFLYIIILHVTIAVYQQHE